MIAWVARLRRAGERRAARYLATRRIVVDAGAPLVSFTFDDFPRSALLNGGAILESAGSRGTYYVSLGQIGCTTETGEQFQPEDIERLLRAGHELGCHTFDHRHPWKTTSEAFEASVEQNARALRDLVPAGEFLTHAYPLSYPRPATKRRLSRHFAACRGGGQTFNTGTVDLNYLSAFFIEQSRGDLAAIRHVIQANACAGGWLIFATHDVTPSPTRYGCTPGVFERIVQDCIASGSTVLPVAEALSALQRRAMRGEKVLPLSSAPTAS